LAEVINAANSLSKQVGVAVACRALRLPRSALYRDRAARHVCPMPIRRARHRAGVSAGAVRTGASRRGALDVLNRPRFVSCTPAAIRAQLLDEGRYVASVRTITVCCKATDGLRHRSSR
jgi:putative transposase